MVSFSDNEAEVKCVAVHQNLVVSGAEDGAHCVWDVRQKRMTREIPDAHDDTGTQCLAVAVVAILCASFCRRCRGPISIWLDSSIAGIIRVVCSAVVTS